MPNHGSMESTNCRETLEVGAAIKLSGFDALIGQDRRYIASKYEYDPLSPRLSNAELQRLVTCLRTSGSIVIQERPRSVFMELSRSLKQNAPNSKRPRRDGRSRPRLSDFGDEPLASGKSAKSACDILGPLCSASKTFKGPGSRNLSLIRKRGQRAPFF